MENEVKSLKHKNYHKSTQCCECGMWMRDNNLKRHSKKHKILTENKELKIEENDELDTDLTLKEINDLNQELIWDNKVYLKKLQRGEQIYINLAEGLIIEDSLSKLNKEALDIFRKSYNPLAVTDVVLRPWQQELLSKMIPTDREIIWIKGANGNEGKTWFQKYIQSQYGHSRVAQLELKSKPLNMLHVLRKFQLSTVDIFLFNDARSIMNESHCYPVLENIKDGCATAMKYNSERIQFKTPNIVVVFSNEPPDMKQLSKDRWKIYYIINGSLVSKEESLWKTRNRLSYGGNYGKNDSDSD